MSAKWEVFVPRSADILALRAAAARFGNISVRTTDEQSLIDRIHEALAKDPRYANYRAPHRASAREAS